MQTSKHFTWLMVLIIFSAQFVHAQGPLSVKISGRKSTCTGINNATLTAVVTGGTPGYTYLWSNGATTATVTGLNDGGAVFATFSITVTDAAGGTATGSYTFIQQPGAFQLSLDETDVTCNNGTDGTITSYRVTGGTEAELIVNSPYSIVNYAAPARFGPSSFNLTGEVVYIPDNTTSYLGCNPFAPGSLAGKIALIDRGGPTACTFVVKVQNAQDAGAIGVIFVSNFPGNIFSFTGTSTTITIPSIMITQADGAALKAVLTNTQVVNATMRSAAIQYLWSNGATTPNLSGLSSGNYSLTLTDLWGCTVSSSVVLNNPPALSLTMAGTNLTCNNSNDGAASVNVTGGNSKCTVRNAGYNQGIRPIGAVRFPNGTYSVLTTGQSFIACNTGLVTSVKVFIFGNSRPAYNMPFKMAAGNNTQTNFYSQMVSVPGTDGFWNINLTTPYPVVSGKTYSFSLGGLGSDTAIFPAFSVVGFSSFNYPGGNSFIETGAAGSADMVFDIKIEVDPAAKYSYLWNNAATTSSISGLTAGNYSVSVTDVKGCKNSGNISLTQPDPLTVDAGPNKIVYKGFPDSACTRLQSSAPTGGTAPYTLTWSNGSHASFIDVCPEVTTTYYLNVTDANGCTFRESVRVCVLDVRCGNKLDKVTVSHRTGSASNPCVTLCVDINGAREHFRNHPGDQLGACGLVKECNWPGEQGLITSKTPVAEKEQLAFDNLLVYPNPSAGNTTIRFKTAEKDYVSIRLVDITGKEISRLYTGATDAGATYTVPVHADKLTNGIYLVIMNTNRGPAATKKLILSK